MAFIQMTCYSAVLDMDVPCNVLLPERKHRAIQPRDPATRYPVLYLLHGHGDGVDAWIRKSTIELVARELPLIVVMPTTQRAFYADGEHGLPYFTYLAEELPRVIENYFPASDRREDRFVAGNSMGGYGALKLAMTHPGRYAAAASLSGALDPVDPLRTGVGDEAMGPGFCRNLRDLFGSVGEFDGSKDDLRHLLAMLPARCAEAGVAQPGLFLCCGTEDPLTYGMNTGFMVYARERCPEVEITYSEGPGAHSWSYWNPRLQDVVSFFGIRAYE